MTHYITNLFVKLGGILQTGAGWATGIALFIADYFAGHAFIVWLVIGVTLMDAVWGIAVSIKQGKFTLSELARLTIQKLAVYGCAMAVFVGMDKVVGTTLSASIVGAAIVLVEFWSASASMLICYPHIVFLRLLRGALTGEIASKLGISVEEVKEALDGSNGDDESSLRTRSDEVTDAQIEDARERAGHTYEGKKKRRTRHDIEL